MLRNLGLLKNLRKSTEIITFALIISNNRRKWLNRILLIT